MTLLVSSSKETQGTFGADSSFAADLAETYTCSMHFRAFSKAQDLIFAIYLSHQSLEANFCIGDPTFMLSMIGGTLEDVPKGILPSVAVLAGSPDPEAALAGLSVFDAVLKGFPGQGAKLVESVDGIEILERQQMG